MERTKFYGPSCGHGAHRQNNCKVCDRFWGPRACPSRAKLRGHTYTCGRGQHAGLTHSRTAKRNGRRPFLITVEWIG